MLERRATVALGRCGIVVLSIQHSSYHARLHHNASRVVSFSSRGMPTGLPTLGSRCALRGKACPPSGMSPPGPRASRVRSRVVVAGMSDGVDGDRVYVGKGKWVRDDARKYPSRTTLTGGWAGGEVGMWEYREAAQRGEAPLAVVEQADDAEEDDDDLGVSASFSSSSPTPSSNAGVDTLKYSLLKALAALDRGVAAGDDDRAAIKELVGTLETLAAASAVTAAATPGRASLAPTDAALEAALDGEWRLAYSSTFAGEQPGSQGFTGAPGVGSQSLGAVWQRIDASAATCDNVVQLSGAGPLTGTAALGHTYAVEGATMTITFTGVTVESPPLGLPPFRLPSPLDVLPTEARAALTGAGVQSGAFDTTFVDGDLRVSRGDRGELRVFVR